MVTFRDALICGLVDITEIGLARQEYKRSKHPSLPTLQDLSSRCELLRANLLQPTLTTAIETDRELGQLHALLFQSVAIQSAKLTKLIKALPISQRQEPEHITILRTALEDLQSGKQKEGLGSIRALESLCPTASGRVFAKIWELAGKPSKKSQPLIAHDQFGSLAFYDYKGTTPQGGAIDLRKRIAAVDAVLRDLSSPPVVALRMPPKEKEKLKDYRRNIWLDTRKILLAGQYTNSQGKIVSIDTSRAVKGTIAYPDAGPKVVRNDGRRQSIVVFGQDCLDVAEFFATQGKKVSLLNMANDEHPSGGVREGGSPQEEEVCRRCGLVDAICSPKRDGRQTRDLYPLRKKIGPVSPGLYTPHVPVFRKGIKQGYALLDVPFEISVLSVAAYRLDAPRPLTATEREDTKERIRTMLEMSYQNGDEVVVLGAFGCGVYNNMPEEMAQIFQEVIDQYYPSAFEHIVFAVIDDKNAKGKNGNFLPFAQHFIQCGGSVIDANGKPLLKESL